MTGQSTAKKASHHCSPLRYPGGKAKLAPYLKSIVRQNGLLDCTYVEPFAGGAGVGLALLLHGYVKQIVLNDLSRPIYAFWRTLLDDPHGFQAKIASVDLTVDEWLRQRETFRRPEEVSNAELGFSAFYLNRTNRSGVLNGGIIGGYAQNATHNIGARFNREELAMRVRRISKYASKINLFNMDARELLAGTPGIVGSGKSIVYIDPPYFHKGRDLYYDFYKADDHKALGVSLSSIPPSVPWVISYDDEPTIYDIYSSYRSRRYSLNYSVKNGRVGGEVMFFSDGLTIPALSTGGLRELDDGAALESGHPPPVLELSD